MQSSLHHRANARQGLAAPSPALRPVRLTQRVRAFTSPVPTSQNGCSTSYIACVEVAWRAQRRRERIVSRCNAQPESPVSEHPFPEEEDFDLLSTKIHDLTKELKEDLRGCSIYLTGMMGSGKSTVGKMLANTLKYAFFDTDVMVEMAHEKKAVAEVFKEYGEEYFRTCESEVLKQLAPYRNLVIATGGGTVIRPMNWSYMQQGVVVWLNGPTDLLAMRVARDGIEKRPLLVATPEARAAAAAAAGTDGRELSDEEALFYTAKAKLETLLEERTKYYENADLKISLEGYGLDAKNGAPTAVVMYRLLCALKDKIEATKKEREDRRNFTIERAGEVPSMKTQEAMGPGPQDENSNGTGQQ